MFKNLLLIDDISATIIDSAQTKTQLVSLKSPAIGSKECDLCLKLVSYSQIFVLIMLVGAQKC
jgi:hypothetical protein